jgi:hypothetical protein
VAQQSRLDVLAAQRLAKERVFEKIDLAIDAFVVNALLRFNRQIFQDTLSSAIVDHELSDVIAFRSRVFWMTTDV